MNIRYLLILSFFLLGSQCPKEQTKQSKVQPSQSDSTKPVQPQPGEEQEPIEDAPSVLDPAAPMVAPVPSPVRPPLTPPVAPILPTPITLPPTTLVPVPAPVVLPTPVTPPAPSAPVVPILPAPLTPPATPTLPTPITLPPTTLVPVPAPVVLPTPAPVTPPAPSAPVVPILPAPLTPPIAPPTPLLPPEPVVATPTPAPVKPVPISKKAIVVPDSPSDPTWVAVAQCSNHYFEQLSRVENFAAKEFTGCFSAETRREAEVAMQDLQQMAQTFYTRYHTGVSGGISADLRDFAASYQRVQDYLAYCRTNYAVQGAEKNEVDSKDFLHVLGDTFAQSTGLEGADPSFMQQFRLKILTSIRDQMKGHVFIANAQQVHPCKDMKLPMLPPGQLPQPDLSPTLLDMLVKQAQDAVKLRAAFESDVVSFQKELKAQLASMAKPGDSVFWAVEFLGHAVFYQIIKGDSPDSFTIRLFNSGDGIETYHAKVQIGYKSQYLPFIEFTDVSYDNLTSLVFLRAMQELKNGAVATKASTLYAQVLTLLQGKVKKTEYGVCDFKDVQLGGTCTYFAQPWVTSDIIASQMGSTLASSQFMADNLELLVGLRVLKGYQSTYAKKPTTEDSNLFKKALVYFSDHVSRLQAEGAFGIGTLGTVADVENEALDQIKRVERAAALAAQKEAPDFEVNLSSKQRKPLQDMGALNLYPYPLAASGSGEIMGAKAVFSLGEYRLPDTIQARIESLTSILENLRISLKNQEYIPALQVVETVALALPLDKEQWKSTTDLQASAFIELISKLSEIELIALKNAIHDKQIPPDTLYAQQFMATLKLLAVCDMLNTQLVNDINPKIPSMEQEVFQKVLRVDNAAFELLDARWQHELRILRKFYPKKDYYTNFFGFHVLPAGAEGMVTLFFDINAADYLKSNPVVTQQPRRQDVLWAESWLKKRPDYETVMKGFIEKAGIAPWNFNCPGAWSVKAPEPRVSLEPLRGEEMARKKAALELLANPSASLSLPPIFFALRNASFVANYLLTGTLRAQAYPNEQIRLILKLVTEGFSIQTTEPCGKPEAGQHTIKSTVFEGFELTWMAYGAYNYMPTDDRKRVQEASIQGTKIKSYIPNVLFLQTALPFKQYQNDDKRKSPLPHYEELEKVYRLPFGAIKTPLRRREDVNELSFTTPQQTGLSTLSLERIRDLLGISAQPNQQIIQTLAYFKKWPDLLVLSEYQRLFEMLMLEPGFLQDQLSVNEVDSHMITQLLASFCKEQLARFKKESNYKAIAFILLMNDLFEEQVRFAIAQSPGTIKARDADLFLNTRETLMSLIKGLPVDAENEKSLLYLVMAQTFLHKSKLNSQEVAELLLSMIQHKLLPLVQDDYLDAYSEDAVRNLLVRFAKDVQDDLRGPASQKTLNFVAQNVFTQLKTPGLWAAPSGQDTLWVGQFGTEHRVTIDVLKGTIFLDNAQLVRSFISSKEFHQVFGDNAAFPAYMKHINDDTLEFALPDGLLGRIITRSTNIGFYQKQIRLKDNVSWYGLSPPAKDSGYSHVEFMDNFQSWTSVDKKRLVLLDPVTKAVSYVGELNSDLRLVSYIRQKDGARLLNPSEKSSYRIFNQIEQEGYIYVWADANTQEVKEVELPRLGLDFKVSSGRLLCANWKDYVVAQKQYTQNLGVPLTYLICEHANAPAEQPTIALMPLRKPEALKKGLTRKFVLAKSTEIKPNSIAVELYRLQEDLLRPERAIEPADDAARLYLALRYLWQQDYAQAARWIRGTGSFLRPFNKQEIEVLKWLSQGNENDNDPRAYAVRLLAVATLFKYNPREYLDRNEPDNLYKRYLAVADKVGQDLLSFEDEKYIFSKFSTTSATEKQLQARIHYVESQTIGGGFFTEVPELVMPSIETMKPNSSYRSLFWDTDKLSENKSASGGSVLTASYILYQSNIHLLYGVAIGSFNRGDALHLLASTLGVSVKEIEGLSDKDIRSEVIRLVGLAEKELTEQARAKKQPYLFEYSRFFAQFLIKLAAAKDANQKVYTYAQLRDLPDAQLNPYMDAIMAIPLYEPLLASGDLADKSAIAIDRPLTPDIVVPTDIIMGDVMIDASADPLQKSVFEATFKNQADVLLQKPLTLQQRMTIEEKAASLMMLLKRADGSTSDIKNATQQVQKKVREHVKEIETTQLFYGVKNRKALQEWKQILVEELKIQRTQLVELRENILQSARLYAPNIQGGALLRVLHLSERGGKIEFNDLLYLLMKRKLSVFYEINGALDKEQLQKMYHDLVRYLLMSTYHTHMGKLVSATSAVEAALSTGVSPDDLEYQQLLSNMMQLGETKRAYNVADHIEYLVFEHFMEILMKPHQVKGLDQLHIKDGVAGESSKLGTALELVMGAGKTSVIVPLLSVLVPDNHLNVVVLPESLVTSMGEQLSNQLYSAFGRSVDVVEFNRGASSSVIDLERLYENLKKSITQHRTVVTTNSTIQSLFLSMINCLHQGIHGPYLNIKPLRGIFRLFKETGHLTIDEVDLALDVLQSHQFSLGFPVPLSEDKNLKLLPVVSLSFYRLLVTQPQLYNQITLPFLPYSAPNKPFTVSYYQNTFKPLLVDMLIAKAREGKFIDNDKQASEQLKKYLNHTSNGPLLLKTYLLSNKLEDRTNLMRSVDNIIVKNICAVLYDSINSIFPLTVSKVPDVHYGPLPAPVKKENESSNDFSARQAAYRKSSFVAIPYHAGIPMPSSRFGSPLESLFYTINLALAKPNYQTAVREEIEQLKTLSRQTSETAEKEYAKRLAELLGSLKLEKPITHFNKADIKKITESLNQRTLATVERQLRFIYRHALPQITVYPEQIFTNAQIYASLFERVNGLTGTMWSFDTFAKMFREPIISDTTEKTLFTLWRQRETSPVQIINGRIDEIYDGKFEGSLMDEAGLLRSFANSQVANEIQQKTHKNVAYYNQSNEIYASTDKGTVPFADVQRQLPKLIVYWDKQHTTGSDFKLKADMTAKMSFDQHIMSRALQQTVWRLRGLDKGQSMAGYLVKQADSDVMMNRLSQDWNVNISGFSKNDVGFLILYSIVNQEARLSELRMRALQQKLTNVYVRATLERILSASMSDLDAIDLYGKVKPLFARKIGEEPLYETMGFPREKVSVDTVLQHSKEQILRAPYAAYLGDFKADIEALIAAERPKLPETVWLTSVEGGDEVEIETEKEVEKEIEKEVEKEQDYAEYRIGGLAIQRLEWPSLDETEKYDVVLPCQKTCRKDDYKDKPPIIALENAWQIVKHKYDTVPVFGPSLLLSLNFAPMLEAYGYEFKFFDYYNKHLDTVLVRVNKTDMNQLKVILLDIQDAAELASLLEQQKKESNSWSGLYNLNTGFFKVSPGVSLEDIARLEKQPNFIRAIVEAKFYGGYLNYNAEQKKVLKDFLRGPSSDEVEQRYHVELMKELFSKILKFKYDSRKHYEHSTIDNVFKSLKIKLER